MSKCKWMLRVFCVLLSLNVLAECRAAEFEFCPAGYFVSDEAALQFKSNPYNFDYEIPLPDNKKIKFSGPIFPGYKLPVHTKDRVDANAKTIETESSCKDSAAKAKRLFKSVNGGIRADYSIDFSGTDQPKDIKYRIMFPVNLLAGKAILHKDGKVTLPNIQGKSKQLHYTRKGGEYRIPIGKGIELGLKILSDVQWLQVNDRRLQNEDHFDIYVSTKDGGFSYFLCLLKSGEEFPDEGQDVENGKELQQAGPKNLLGEGAGFEVGVRNFTPFAYYSWSESWTSPASAPKFDSQAKKEGQYSLCLTADDMKAVDGRFNMNAAVFRAVRLDPNRTYTLSAWMKTDKESLVASMCCAEGVWDGGKGKKVKVADEWARYSYTFKPEKYKKLNYCTTWIGVHPKTFSGRLWIDGVELEEGEGDQYRPQAFEFGAVLESKHKLYTLQEMKDTSVVLRFRNNGAKALSGKVDYKILDYWDKEVASGSHPYEIAPAENMVSEIKLPQLPLGYYRIYLEADSGKSSEEIIFGVYSPVEYAGQFSASWPLGCDGLGALPVIRDLGFGWTRAWDFKFSRVCPTADTFNFRETDIMVQKARKLGINVMAILGNSLVVYSPERAPYRMAVPEWAIDRIGKCYKSRSWAKHGVAFPKIDAWKRYVKALVGRYKNDIKAWEVMNEPNCWVSADEYAPYMQAAFEAAKEADPDCILVGGGATSDLGEKPAPWTTRLLELDRLGHMDALSIHMYGNKMPELMYDSGTYGMLDFLQKTMRGYGKVLPIWHTEKGYVTPKTGYSRDKLGKPGIYLRSGVPGHAADNFRTKAEYLMRETLIDSCVGKGPFFWFGNMPNDIHIACHRSSRGYHHIEFDGSPAPELLAANGLARMLEGRENPRELIKISVNVFCALYEGDKGVLASVWDITGKNTLSIAEEVGAFKCYNFFGVQKTLAKAGVVEINTAPVYLTFDAKNVAEVKALLARAKPGGDRFRVSGGLELENGKPVLAVYGLNLGSSQESFKVSLTESPEGWAFSGKSGSAMCNVEQYARVSLPVNELSASGDFQMQKVVAGEQAQTIPLIPFDSEKTLKAVLDKSEVAFALPTSDKELAVDGDLSDWSADGVCGAAISDKVKTGRGIWRNALDLSCKFRFRYDGRHLYVGAVVYDDVVERNAATKSSYCSDGIELFLSLTPGASDSGSPSVTKDNCFQILLAPDSGDDKYPNATAWCVQTKDDAGIQVKSGRISTGYAIEAAIPWKNLRKGFTPATGETIAMTYQVTDCDKPGGCSAKTVYWAGNGVNYKHSKLWGKLTFK